MQAAPDVSQAAPPPVVAFTGRHPETTGLYRVMQKHLGTRSQFCQLSYESTKVPKSLPGCERAMIRGLNHVSLMG